MKIYIWERVERCTHSYHSEGGVVVFAETEERARELANQESGCEISEGESPNKAAEVVYEEEAVYLFPDAGCC